MHYAVEAGINRGLELSKEPKGTRAGRSYIAQTVTEALPHVEGARAYTITLPPYYDLNRIAQDIAYPIARVFALNKLEKSVVVVKESQSPLPEVNTHQGQGRIQLHTMNYPALINGLQRGATMEEVGLLINTTGKSFTNIPEEVVIFDLKKAQEQNPDHYPPYLHNDTMIDAEITYSRAHLEIYPPDRIDVILDRLVTQQVSISDIAKELGIPSPITIKTWLDYCGIRREKRQNPTGE